MAAEPLPSHVLTLLSLSCYKKVWACLRGLEEGVSEGGCKYCREVVIKIGFPPVTFCTTFQQSLNTQIKSHVKIYPRFLKWAFL